MVRRAERCALHEIDFQPPVQSTSLFSDGQCDIARSATFAREGRLSAHMTTTKSKSGDKSYSKSSRCWPGYEPVPGKGEHEEGSCRKKPGSRNGGKPVDRETARKKQIALGGKRAEQAKSKSPSASERSSLSKAQRRAPKRTPKKAAA
jgi:hypothetical protein